MTTIATREAPPEAAPAPAVPRSRRRWTRRILPAYTWLMIFYLSLPILVMIAFGFNDTTGRLNLRWQGFTLKWYRDLFQIQALTTALRNSLLITVISTIGVVLSVTVLIVVMAGHIVAGRAGVKKGPGGRYRSCSDPKPSHIPDEGGGGCTMTGARRWTL